MIAAPQPVRRWIGFLRLVHGEPQPRVIRNDVDRWRRRQASAARAAMPATPHSTEREDIS